MPHSIKLTQTTNNDRSIQVDNTASMFLTNSLHSDTTADSNDELSYYATVLSDDELDQIALILKEPNTLKKLYLNQCFIVNDGVSLLADALMGNTTLEALSLHNNQIRDNGVIAIAKALEQNSTLKILDLSGNYKIQQPGIERLCQSLEKNQFLQTLDLSHIYIGDIGAQHLARALKNNKALTTLKLSFTGIGSEGIKALTEVLPHASLTVLELGDKGLNDTSRQVLLDTFIKQDADFKVLHDSLLNLLKAQTIHAEALTEEDRLAQYHVLKYDLEHRKKALQHATTTQLHIIKYMEHFIATCFHLKQQALRLPTSEARQAVQAVMAQVATMYIEKQASLGWLNRVLQETLDVMLHKTSVDDYKRFATSLSPKPSNAMQTLSTIMMALASILIGFSAVLVLSTGVGFLPALMTAGAGVGVLTAGIGFFKASRHIKPQQALAENMDELSEAMTHSSNT